MNFLKLSKSLPAACSFWLLTVLGSFEGRAALRTWDGGGTNSGWTTATNWVGDMAPMSGDDLVFPSGAARLSNSNNFPAGTTFNSIIISGGSYFFSGSRIALNAGINASSNTGPSTSFLPLTLNSNQTITAGIGGIDLYDSIDTNGKDLTISNGSFTVFAVISGTGGLIKVGNASAVSVEGSNTFSGLVQVLQGYLGIDHSSGLGSTNGNTIVSAGATLGVGSGIVVPEPIVLLGTLASSYQTNALTGPVSLAVTNATIQTYANAPLTINGIISGGGFTKTGPDVLTLNAANTYTGLTTIAGGTLRINATQSNSVIALTGGALGGAGIVGNVTASNAVTNGIAPGNGGPGILTCSNLALSASTIFAVKLNGTTVGSGYDQLRVRGTIALSNAPILVTVGFASSVGQSFTIIDNDSNDPVVGNFGGLPEGAIFAFGTNQFAVTYAGGTGNDVVLVRTNVSLPGVRIWTGAGNNSFWSNPNNWTNNLAAAPGDDLVFPLGAARLTNTNDFPAGTIFNSITIAGANYSLYGSNTVLNAGINATNTTVQNFVILPLTLNSNQTITTGNSGVNLYVSGNINLNGKDLTIAGNGRAQVSATISGAGGLIKSGNGNVLLYASNTFSAAVQILQGGLWIYHSSALGSINVSTTISAGGTLAFANALTVAEPLVLAGTLANAAGLAVNLTGPINLTASNATISAPLTINGVISGSGGFTETGSDILSLNATNTYTGTTTVGGGILQVNGSQPDSPIVLNGSTVSLVGTGRVGTVTAGVAGLKFIRPAYFSPGVLNSSNVTMSASTYFSVDLNGTSLGTGYDQLNVTGTANLGGANLDISLGFTPNVGDSFKIINNDNADAVTGAFSGLSEGKVFTNSGAVFQISYVGGDGNDVVLYRVNPPAQLSAIAALTNGVKQIQGLGLSNLTYIIQAAANLNPVIQWSNLGTAPANGSGQFSFTDTNAPLFPARFYRVQSP